MALLNIKEKEDVTRFTKDLLAGGMSGIFAKTLGKKQKNRYNYLLTSVQLIKYVNYKYYF